MIKMTFSSVELGLMKLYYAPKVSVSGSWIDEKITGKLD